MLWESSSPLETHPHLVESIPCEDPTCYLWQANELPCIPTNGSCGPGTAIQNVSCVNTEGKVPDLHDMKLVKLINKTVFKILRNKYQNMLTLCCCNKIIRVTELALGCSGISLQIECQFLIILERNDSNSLFLPL